MKNETWIELICDQSGSIFDIRHEALGGINRFIDDQKKLSGEARVGVTLFNAGPSSPRRLYSGVRAREARSVNEEEFTPNGLTALSDAVGIVVDDLGQRLDRMPESERPNKVIIVISTDGLENSSHKYKTSEIKEKLEHQQKVYSWEVIYLGQHIGTSVTAANYGIHMNNTRQFDATAQGMCTTYNVASNMVRSIHEAGHKSHVYS